MAFDKNKPFKNRKFLNEFLNGLRNTKFKLYGKIPFKFLEARDVEIDCDFGQIHLTEIDMNALSQLMNKTNKKHKTKITYCWYHTEQFPGDQILNVRSPTAPKLLSNKIKFAKF